MRYALIALVLAIATLLIAPTPAQAMYRDGPNLYQYVRSNPVRYVDWNGAQAAEPDPAPAKPAPAPKPQYGLNVSNPVIRAALIQIMTKMCPCFDYKKEGKDNARITIVDKPAYKPDGTKPSKDFCCCYYSHLPGCNLLMTYRARGGQGSFPSGTDFIVIEGAAPQWKDGKMLLPPSPPMHAFAHEMLHGVTGTPDGSDKNSPLPGRPAINAATTLIDPSNPYNNKNPGNTLALNFLQSLTSDHAGCNKRPEFSAKPTGTTPETTEAIKQFEAYRKKAKEIYDNMQLQH